MKLNPIFLKIVKATVKRVEKKLGIKFSKVEISETMSTCDVDTGTKVLRIGIPAVEGLGRRNTKELERDLLRIVVHEGLHLRGFFHDYRGRKIGFYSHSIKDQFTLAVIELMFKENK